MSIKKNIHHIQIIITEWTFVVSIDYFFNAFLKDVIHLNITKQKLCPHLVSAGYSTSFRHIAHYNCL